MTKEEYLKWLETRGEAGTWDLRKCREADALIKRETLQKADSILRQHVKHAAIRQFTFDMLRYNFGTGEVDQLLMELKAYPDWMEK
jgi:hypothetical protein